LNDHEAGMNLATQLFNLVKTWKNLLTY
jgi:hypothetical protein